jgi:hypothetical protein
MTLTKSKQKSPGRARKVIRRGSRRTTGKFPTLKPEKRSVHWEGPLERDFIFLLEIDPEVASYREQPLKIEYAMEGKKHVYTPDFLVERKGKKQLAEVTLRRKVKERDAAFRIISTVCARNGYEFVVVTEDEIRLQPRLNNVKLLWRYSRTSITPQHQIACQEYFSGSGEATLADLMASFATKGIGKQLVYGLLYHGLLDFDLMKPITPESLVRLPKSQLAATRVITNG